MRFLLFNEVDQNKEGSRYNSLHMQGGEARRVVVGREAGFIYTHCGRTIKAYSTTVRATENILDQIFFVCVCVPFHWMLDSKCSYPKVKFYVFK